MKDLNKDMWHLLNFCLQPNYRQSFQVSQSYTTVESLICDIFVDMKMCMLLIGENCTKYLGFKLFYIWICSVANQPKKATQNSASQNKISQCSFSET